MNTELNKQVAQAFYECFDADDIPGALATMSDDLRFWLAGKTGSVPTAGWHTKAEMSQIFYAMTEQMTGGLRMKVKSLIAEGDRVAVEVESHGELKNGRVYENSYHALLTIRDGKICEFKEYMDTLHVKAIWFTR